MVPSGKKQEIQNKFNLVTTLTYSNRLQELSTYPLATLALSIFTITVLPYYCTSGIIIFLFFLFFYFFVATATVYMCLKPIVPFSYSELSI